MTTKRLGVFSDNRRKPIHRWYPFVEGYSADLVSEILDKHPPQAPVFDPFGGSGTTALAVMSLGFDAAFTEVNPYLQWVAQAKTNRAREAYEDDTIVKELLRLSDRIEGGKLPHVAEHPLLEVDSKRQFFPPNVTQSVVGLLKLCEDLSESGKHLASLAVATSLVPASNMIRRTDLRRRTAKDPRPDTLVPMVIERLHQYAVDITEEGHQIRGSLSSLGQDVRTEWEATSPIDLVVTSPPYLNGTNYCRNTKLELLALGFVESEADLAALRTASIAAGINNISRGRRDVVETDEVEKVAQVLDKVAYDRRIPALVRGYFSDMSRALCRIRSQARGGAHLYLDIGDSKYCGVHVPTDKLLVGLADQAGWQLADVRTLRERRSYDGSTLTQVLLHMVAK